MKVMRFYPWGDCLTDCLLSAAVLPVFREDAIFIGFLEEEF